MFLPFIAFVSFSYIFLYMYYPETKGKSPKQVEDMFLIGVVKQVNAIGILPGNKLKAIENNNTEKSEIPTV